MGQKRQVDVSMYWVEDKSTANHDIRHWNMNLSSKKLSKKHAP